MKKPFNKFPLTIEPYPENYNGPKFISVIRYNDENYVNIIDNIYNKQIIAYVLDFCNAANVNEQHIIDIANNWFETEKNYPISVEFSRLNISNETSKILRCFPLDYVSRVIGPLPEYNLDGPKKVKKRKRKPIPKNIEFINKSSKIF